MADMPPQFSFRHEIARLDALRGLLRKAFKSGTMALVNHGLRQS